MVMPRYILRLLVIVLTLFASPLVSAAELVGIGDFADSLIAPVGVVSDFVNTAATIVGIACIFGAFLRFGQFRINPVAAPISSVIILFILGLSLLCLPLLNVVLGDRVAFLHK
jgi:hypothetical protein